MADRWNPPVEVSVEESAVLKLCKKQKLWGFLRSYRHEILDDEVQAALAAMYANDPRGGHPPLAPERLALAMLLQAGFGVADHEVPTLTAVDRRWQMVLDCMGATTPAFSQGTVFSFRERARAHGLMTVLLNKTVELARASKGFDHKRLRAIFDSSPLFGAGRVEDTFNLLGRAIVQLLEAAAEEGSVDATKLARELDVSVFGASSVKAMLDVDWREPRARARALSSLLEQFARLQSWLRERFDEAELARPPLSERLETVRQIIEQDTEPDPEAPGKGKAEVRRVREGVAKDRLISLSDRDQRHGRKSRTKAIHGYKRHVAVDADVPGLIHAAVVQPANKREHDAASPLIERLEANGSTIVELHHDRGYLPAEAVVAKHHEGVKVVSKPPTIVRNDFYAKDEFAIDFEEETVTCPAGVTVPLRIGKTIAFPIESCRECKRRKRCTKSRQRQISIHHEERWHREMAQELATKKGRAARRERVAVEHTLARVSAIQGNRARFRGLAKNQFDLERTAVVNNCFVIAGQRAA
ncbi:MAG: hypothetical protein RIS86_298 [Planctomycetota bacterium]|jgi:IS5 family transposase